MALWAGVGFAAAPALPVLHVSETEIHDVTGVAGVLEGTEMAEARARIGGTVEAVKVVRGEAVTKGQVLAVVVDKKIGQQVAGLGPQVAAAELNVTRLKELLPLDAASKAQVEQAEAQLAALRAQQQNAGQSGTDGKILAPFDGQFVALHVAKGAVMMPGESFGTVAATPLRVKLALPERHAGLLAVGDEVPLVDENGAPRGVGTVSRIEAQVVGGKIPVDVALSDGDLHGLTVGQRVMAQVSTGVRRGIVLPAAYVRMANGLAFVKLAPAAKGDEGLEIPVQIGAVRGGMVEVLSGVRAGDALMRP